MHKYTKRDFYSPFIFVNISSIFANFLVQIKKVIYNKKKRATTPSKNNITFTELPTQKT